jgi:predicted aspartyl protease
MPTAQELAAMSQQALVQVTAPPGRQYAIGDRFYVAGDDGVIFDARTGLAGVFSGDVKMMVDNGASLVVAPTAEAAPEAASAESAAPMRGGPRTVGAENPS